MNAIDMATLGLLSLAVFLQVLAGLVPILYEDLNPAKEVPEEAEAVLNVPKSTALVILIRRSDAGDYSFEEGLVEALAEGDDVHPVLLSSPLLPSLLYEPSANPGLLWANHGMFHKWYTREAQVVNVGDVHTLRFDREGQMVDRDSELVQGIDALPYKDVVVYCSLPRLFGRQDWELAAYRTIWQRSSLLLVGVAALVRFAYGEPILRLF
ncbi:MAG: hypothetical protein OXE43_04990 [Chloroflexi bacterium]|nr:hypothetical protein [Chloroflexota bacterium]